jgi:orotidine-5'-phosphate decarboxylase
MNNVGLLINSSRGIIYASSGTDFAEKKRAEALKMQQEMELILSKVLMFKFSTIKIYFLI